MFALLAGVGITNASQNAFNRIWGVPFKRRPNFFAQRLRSLGMLLLLGALTIVSATAAGFVGASDHSTGAVVASELIAVLSNLVVFTLAFKLLTAKELTLRDVIVGVVVATILIQGLQHLGGLYLAHTLERTTPLYGAFAVVLGLWRGSTSPPNWCSSQPSSTWSPGTACGRGASLKRTSGEPTSAPCGSPHAPRSGSTPSTSRWISRTRRRARSSHLTAAAARPILTTLS